MGIPNTMMHLDDVLVTESTEDEHLDDVLVTESTEETPGPSWIPPEELRCPVTKSTTWVTG